MTKETNSQTSQQGAQMSKALKTPKRGIIYCVCNPLFPDLVKIGKTKKESVEKRGLNASNVPEDFKTIWAYLVNDMKEVETYIHDKFDEFRHETVSGRSTEFFDKRIAKLARDYMDGKALKELTQEVQKADDEAIKKEKRRGNRTFAKAKIDKGEKLFFSSPNGKHPSEGRIVTVEDDINQVKLGNEKMSISKAASKLYKSTCNGFAYFKYNGKLITDILK